VGTGLARVKYRTIVADPPWDYGKDAGRWLPTGGDCSRRRPIPYPPMGLDEIAALPVRDLAEDDACLWLWTTNQHLPESFRIVKDWGFRYRQTIVWAKTNAAPFGGAVCPNSAEYLLFCKRGSAASGRWSGGSVITTPLTGAHSRKPEVFLDLIESVSPAPRLEMFARRQRLGWDTWGNEALCHVQMTSKGD
jgi:N6-adenosine-specific RNA methylase IME4